MYKDGQTLCLGLFISLLHKIGSCSTFFVVVFFVLLCNYLSRMKTNGLCVSNIANRNAHLNFRGMQAVFCVVLQKKML